MLLQFAQLAKLAQLDKFISATDRKFFAKNNILVCSNLTIFRNKTTGQFKNNTMHSYMTVKGILKITTDI